MGKKMTKKGISLSIVIPVLNEEGCIDAIFSELAEILHDFADKYEVIFVDDGSTDKTLDAIKTLAEKNETVSYLSLRRNFGQTAAMVAGFDHASGDIIIPMDGDLQNDPADIPRLIAKLEEGFDVVSGWRKNRKDSFISRKLPSIIANRLISRITGVRLHDYGCTLKAYRRDVLDNMNLYGEMHRFIPALASLNGARVTEIPVNHRERKYGQSNYGISRTSKVILDLITVKFLLSYSTKPMRLFGPLGFGAIALSMVSGAAAVYMKLFDELMLNRNPLFLLSIILLFMGVQLVSLGLVAEINVRTYHESQGKTIYVIKEMTEKKPTL